MKVQEYMLKALKDAVQMVVEGRQFYLVWRTGLKAPGSGRLWSTWRSRKNTTSKNSTRSTAAWRRTPVGRSPSPPSNRPSTSLVRLRHGHDQDEQGTGGDDDLQALKTGIKMEECSIDDDTKLAKEVTNPLARRFFMSVAHEERGHYLTLMDMHNYLTLPEDWFYVTQGGHVDGA